MRPIELKRFFNCKKPDIKMSKLIFVAGFMACLLMMLSCQPDDTKTKKQPNVIVLLVDDAGYADFGFAGSKDLKTPNIDKLANNGMVFTDAHVSASVCGLVELVL